MTYCHHDRVPMSDSFSQRITDPMRPSITGIVTGYKKDENHSCAKSGLGLA